MQCERAISPKPLEGTFLSLAKLSRITGVLLGTLTRSPFYYGLESNISQSRARVAFYRAVSPGETFL